MGSFPELFPRIVPGDKALGYAHNDYAQLLAETGLVGAAVLVAAVAVWLTRLARFRREAGWPARLVGAGAWAALAGIAAHSAFDWNLHVPANALLACLVAGLAAASAPPAGPPAAPPTGGSLLRRRGPAVLLAAASILAAVLLARDAATETTRRELREALVAARLADRHADRPRAAGQLATAIAAGERMARWDPASAELSMLLGQACLHLAAEPQPIDQADAAMEAARRWFAAARRRSAAGLGLPEPAPPPASVR